MSDPNTSTLQSYLDKASGLAQDALGSLTGSQADKNEAEEKKATADARDAVSHAGGNVGGYSVAATGVAANDPGRREGAWKQTLGAGQEAVGGALGLEGVKQAGARQHAEGQEQEAAGQLRDLGAGVAGRVQGAVGGAIAGWAGDEAEQERRARQHDVGKTLQRGAEADIQKQAPQ